MVHLGDEDAVQLADLVGGQSRATGRAHRGDHVVDETLQAGQFVGRHLQCALAQDGVAGFEDRARHSRIGIRTPRSAATSIARS